MALDVRDEMKERFMAATNNFVDKVKDDPNIIAIMICGSLAYDKVWEKSDVDMTVIIRDQSLKNDSYCVIEDGILINVHLVTRSEFKRGFEKSIGGSFLQSYYAKGKMIYTSDDSLNDYLEDIRHVGRDDMEWAVFINACELVHACDKCLKWLTVKNDPLYAQFYLLKAVDSIARIEVTLNGDSPTRECIQKAFAINPDIITPFYQDAMSHHFSKDEILKALDLIDEYLMKNLDVIKQPVLDFMSDQEIKTATLITKRFHMEGHFLVGIFDYLAEKGVIEKVSQTIRITPKSKMAVEELGYLYIPD
ncbi:MAG: nucleotidyltransferase [Anaerocolumna sp.]|jgi:predicted nucleotidyltransferase|nr:nucleotidyltransferase [Anaerocolumna sp.]